MMRFRQLSKDIRRIHNTKYTHTLKEPSFAPSSIMNMFNVSRRKIDTSTNRDIGLHSYMKLVGATTCQNLGITAIIGTMSYKFVSSYPELLLSYGGFTGWLTVAFTGFYSCYKVAIISPQYKKNNDNILIAINTQERLLWSNLLFACQGIVISPSLIIFSPYVPTAALVATAMTVGSISIALYLPKGNMLQFGPALYTSLYGLIGCGIVGTFIPAFHTIDLYAGIGIFTLYNMYDTHKLIKDYDNGYVDHLLHSVDYSLNFINLFIRLLEILSKNDKKNRSNLM